MRRSLVRAQLDDAVRQEQPHIHISLRDVRRTAIPARLGGSPSPSAWRGCSCGRCRRGSPCDHRRHHLLCPRARRRSRLRRLRDLSWACTSFHHGVGDAAPGPPWMWQRCPPSCRRRVAARSTVACPAPPTRGPGPQQP